MRRELSQPKGEDHIQCLACNMEAVKQVFSVLFFSSSKAWYYGVELVSDEAIVTSEIVHWL